MSIRTVSLACRCEVFRSSPCQPVLDGSLRHSALHALIGNC